MLLRLIENWRRCLDENKIVGAVLMDLSKRNKCTKLRKKAIKFHFAKVTGNGTMTNRCFWKTVKPFLNSKGDHGQQTIILEEMTKYIKTPQILLKFSTIILSTL